jgi:hypothetical protein
MPEPQAKKQKVTGFFQSLPLCLSTIIEDYTQDWRVVWNYVLIEFMARYQAAMVKSTRKFNTIGFVLADCRDTKAVIPSQDRLIELFHTRSDYKDLVVQFQFVDEPVPSLTVHHWNKQ